MSRQSKRHLLLLWSLAATFACQQTASDVGSDPLFRRAEEQLAVQREKLDAIRRAIDDAERRLEEAKARAEFQACRAKLKELRAEVERRKAECVKEIADQNLCVVRNEKRTAGAGLAGCTGGIIITLLSGGATAWSLAGCALGVGTGSMNEDRCPVPTCAGTIEHLTPQVLAERSLDSMPRCGGYVGLELSEVANLQDGMRLGRIGEGTYAAASGLKTGDIILALNGHPTTTLRGLRWALETSHDGQSMPVRFVRDGRLFESHATATRGGFYDAQPTLRLGSEVTVATASYRAGTKIESVSAEGPALSAGLASGDRLLTISAGGGLQQTTIATIDDAERALEDCGPSETVTFNVARGAERLSISVPLKPRGAQQSL